MNKILNRAGWTRLDKQLRQADEDRWLSSRYAPGHKRQALVGLYTLNWELARVRHVVSEPALGAIRFQWWREAVDVTAADYPRRHDGVLALAECVATGTLTSEGLNRLIDRHEDAFEAEDPAQQPMGTLAGMATQILAPAHGWSQYIQPVARHYAALKRGEAVGAGPVAPPAPSKVRPALAHFRLRWILANEQTPTALRKRGSVLQAMLSGRI